MANVVEASRQFAARLPGETPLENTKMSFQNASIKAIGPKPEEYFTQPVARGEKTFEISSSALKEFAKCPSRWRDGYESPESKSKDFGSLLDCIALTPDEFSRRYVIRPATYESEGMQCPLCNSVTDSKKCKACGIERVKVPVFAEWSAQSKTCQKWESDKREAGFEVIGTAFYQTAKDAFNKLRSDEVITAFVDASDKQVWLSGEWNDEATGLTIPVKALLDLVPRNGTEFSKCLGDLKTARNAAVLPWQRQVFDMGYHVQAAFNYDLYLAATQGKEDRVQFCFIVQENFRPWQTGKRILSQAFMELGRAEYVAALKNYCQCIKSGAWPGYDDTDESVQGWSVTEPTPWMEGANMFRPKFQTEAADETEPEYCPPN